MRGFFRNIFPWLLAAVLAATWGSFVLWMHQPLRTQNQYLEEVLRAAGSDASECEESLEICETRGTRKEERMKDLEASNVELDRERSALQAGVDRKALVLEALNHTVQDLYQNLEAEIHGGEILIKQRHGTLVVDINDKILFDSAQVEIKPRGREILMLLGQTLLQSSDRDIQVGGHTDPVPISDKLAEQYPTKWDLSTARATQVVRFLQSEAGLPGARLIAAGFAQYRPVTSNATKRGRRLNRRIEIVLLPKPAGD